MSDKTEPRVGPKRGFGSQKKALTWKYMTFMWPKKLLMDLAKGTTNKHDKDPVTWR